jgi:hypothetical protein
MSTLTRQEALTQFQNAVDPSATWDDYFGLVKHISGCIPNQEFSEWTAENLHRAAIQLGQEIVENAKAQQPPVELQRETEIVQTGTIDLAELEAETELRHTTRELARVKVNDLAATFQLAYSEDFGVMLANLKPLIPQIDKHAGHQLLLQTLHALETEKRAGKRNYRNSILDIIQNTLRITIAVSVISFGFSFSLPQSGLNGLATSAVLSPMMTWYKNKKSLH